MKTTQVQLLSSPDGVPTEAHFQLIKVELPLLLEGEVLCETRHLSLDPYMRSQISGRHISGAIGPGDCMKGETISQIIESRCDEFVVGDVVRVMGGWQTHSIHRAGELAPVPSGDVPPSYYLSSLGMPGLTAYAGLIWRAQPKAGETVLIPAATGGVGSMAGQLAKAQGCRVIGIAGGEEKCRLALETLGYDECINRKTADVAAELDRLCPDGVDVFFDLVGGELLHQVSQRLKPDARVVLCGMIAEYNSKERMPGPPPAVWIIARATVYGLVVYDFEARRQVFVDAVAPMIANGSVKVIEDVAQGLEQAPKHFCRLMRGENQGKAVVQIN